MPGFPLWPGRRCSVFEEMDLEKLVQRKSNQVGIVFFEKKPKKAWMCEDSLQEFTLDTSMKESRTSLFKRKLFESNLNYQQAVVEGVRIVRQSFDMNNNGNVDTPFVQLINKYNKQDSEGNYCCELCGGSSYSGELRHCCSIETNNGRCGGKGRVHYHCFEKDAMTLQLDDRWYCLSCSQSYGWTNSVLLPEDPSLVPFFGTVDKYLPPSQTGQGDQLYHVLFEDGDGEEYFQDELVEVMTTYDSFYGSHHNNSYCTVLAASKSSAEAAQKSDWTTEHPSVGIRVCKYFDGVLLTQSLPVDQDQISLPAGLASSEHVVVATSSKTDKTPNSSTATVVNLSREDATQSLPKSELPPPRRSTLPLSNAHAVLAAGSSGGPNRRDRNSPVNTLSRSKRWEAYLQTQEAVKRKLNKATIDIGSSFSLPVASGAAESAVIRKRARILEEESPVKDNTDRSACSQHSNKSPEKRACYNPENAQIITFFDECLTEMTKHREHMERARERTIHSKETVGQTFAHQIVENLAGDLIKTINRTLKDIPSASNPL